MSKAIKNFFVGALVTLAMFAGSIVIAWATHSILELFRPFGMPGALAAFALIMSVVVGIGCFAATLVSSPTHQGE